MADADNQPQPGSGTVGAATLPGIGRPQQATSEEDVFRSGRVIMLGFTGSLGSGCSFLAKGLKEFLGTDAYYYKLASYIRESLKQQGVQNPGVGQMQDEGNRLRRDNGLKHLVDLCVNEIVSKEKDCVYDEKSVILIDGIRNPGEVQSLRVNPNFYLVSVHASWETRVERLVGLGPEKDFKTEEDFKIADSRDAEEEGIDWGQKIRVCNDLADIILNNDVKLLENTVSKTQFFAKFVSDYLTVIRALRDGTKVADRPPSMDETLMTMAFCASRRSSCDKQKVGAIVAYVKEFPEARTLAKRREDEKRYQVIASGYNEVPLGTAPCRLGQYEQCYRDRLRGQVSKSFKHCPSCAKEIPPESQTYERLRRYECECGVRLKDCLPGAGDATGKLLDMCKALHAEENAILALSGISKNSGGELVLYTTTFPCNLCANKIVEAGIDCVVFAEPYPMAEAKEILRLGGVGTRKFEGVKSSAYFRMYA